MSDQKPKSVLTGDISYRLIAGVGLAVIGLGFVIGVSLLHLRNTRTSVVMVISVIPASSTASQPVTVRLTSNSANVAPAQSLVVDEATSNLITEVDTATATASVPDATSISSDTGVVPSATPNLGQATTSSPNLVTATKSGTLVAPTVAHTPTNTTIASTRTPLAPNTVAATPSRTNPPPTANTFTPTRTNTAAQINTLTPTRTYTLSALISPTATRTNTLVTPASATPTRTLTTAPANTYTPTATKTVAVVNTATFTPTITSTATVTTQPTSTTPPTRTPMPGCPSVPVPTTAVRIMPLGDSITEGYTGHASYRYWLWHRLQDAGYRNVDFVGSQTGVYDGPPLYSDFDQNHEGHFGWTIDQILAQVSGWATAAQPQVVLIHLGSNDILGQHQDAAGAAWELSQVIDALRAVNPSVAILLAQIIPSDREQAPNIPGFNAQIATVGANKNTPQSPIIVVDQYTGFDLSDTYDGIHPNESGEKKLSDKWFPPLTCFLAPPN